MEEKIFEFKNIFIEVVNQDKNIDTKYVRLLDGISGSFKSGRLTAIIGASGAGKSTLFDVLLGRIDNLSKTYGTILYNGKERSTEDWIHQVSYLKQFDIFFPKFSIMESIMFNLDFYRPDLSKKEKIAFAEEILKTSNIYEKRYAYVESLSGGECKRAMIALSLCSDPEIIFMDEPTSGLDSHSALMLINFIKSYAEKNNKIVVISLHQPGEALFNLFEDILYLGRGAVFYEGKVNKIGSWLEEKGLKKIEGISLAEYIFELHSDNPFPPEIARSRPLVDEIIETNRKAYNELRKNLQLEKDLSYSIVNAEFSFGDLNTLLSRFFLHLWRSGQFMGNFIYNTIIIGAFAALYLLSAYSSFKEFANKKGGGNGTFSQIVEIVKNEMSENGHTLIIYNIYLFFYISLVSYGLCSFNFDFFGHKNYISEDILAGKYSILTSFMANLIHDIISTTFWLIIAPIVAYLSPLRTLLPSMFLPFFLLYAFSYAIGYMFLRHICGGGSKISLFVLYGISMMVAYGTTAVFDIIANINTSILGWFKYGSYIYLLCPQVICMHIIHYRRYLLAKAIFENSENFFLNQTEEAIATFKSETFNFLRLENLPPYWVCYVILLFSITVNILASFYLFSKQIKASLRLKLN